VLVGNYHYFKIYDPKERTICAAAFSERVIHHALMNVCHANFDRFQIFDSYACRLGKGTYAALNRAKQYQQKYKYFLKLDVRKYFDTIEHNVLKNMLAGRFKEVKLLTVFEQIIDSYHTQPNKGLPIGNLTSQYFANHYLALADHYLKEVEQQKAYIRYMDDMVLWDNDKSALLKKGVRFEHFIAQKLQVELKPLCLNYTAKGLPFLGYRLYPDTVLLTRSSKKRFECKLKKYTDKLHDNEWNQQDYQRHILPLLACIKHADTFAFRQNKLKIMKIA